MRSAPASQRFGDNLRDCRRRAGISQERLAALADLHRTAIGFLEDGRREPRMMTIIKLAAALEVSPERLLAGIGWQVVVRSSGVLLIDERIAN